MQGFHMFRAATRPQRYRRNVLVAKRLVIHRQKNAFKARMMRQAVTTLLGRMAVSLLAVIFSAASANAGDPSGLWYTERQLAKVLITKCSEEFCGTIVALKDPIDPTTGRPQTDTENEDKAKRNRPVIGIQVVIGMKPDGENKWSGQLYNAEDGKTYDGSLILDAPNILKVRGCIMMGVVCETQNWTRSK